MLKENRKTDLLNIQAGILPISTEDESEEALRYKIVETLREFPNIQPKNYSFLKKVWQKVAEMYAEKLEKEEEEDENYVPIFDAYDLEGEKFVYITKF